RLLAAGGFLGLHLVAHRQHVLDRDAFGDADNEVEVGLDRFPDRVGRAGRRHVDDADVGAGVRLGVLDAGVDRDAFEALAGLLRVDAGDEAGLAIGVGLAALGVELAGLARDALR